jgi:CHAD domain-containing protein
MTATPNRAATKAGPPRLHRHLLGFLSERWDRYRKRLKRCRRECSEESVHDLRVEIRRLLSAAELTGIFISRRRREKNRRLLKKHLDWFDELRDIQVQLLRLAPLARRAGVAQRYRAYLCRREERVLQETGRRPRRARTSRLRRALERIRREIRERRDCGLEERDLAAMRRALGSAYARVVHLLARVDPARTDTFHRTRVALKNYRYMVEALPPALSGLPAHRLRAMHDYQNLMGDIQDLVVLAAGFEAFASQEKLDARQARAFRAGIELLRRAAIRAFLKQANHLAAFCPASIPTTLDPLPPAPARPA